MIPSFIRWSISLNAVALLTLARETYFLFVSPPAKPPFPASSNRLMTFRCRSVSETSECDFQNDALFSTVANITSELLMALEKQPRNQLNQSVISPLPFWQRSSTL